MAAVNPDQEALAKKRATFAQLDALHQDDDHVRDEGLEKSKLALAAYSGHVAEGLSVGDVRKISSGRPEAASRVLQRSTSVKEAPVKSVAEARSYLLQRSESTSARRPLITTSRTSSDEVVVKDTPVVQKRKVAQVDTAENFNVAAPQPPSTTMVARILGKRKRSSGLQQVPIEQQIFRGLTMSCASSFLPMPLTSSLKPHSVYTCRR